MNCVCCKTNVNKYVCVYMYIYTYTRGQLTKPRHNQNSPATHFWVAPHRLRNAVLNETRLAKTERISEILGAAAPSSQRFLTVRPMCCVCVWLTSDLCLPPVRLSLDSESDSSDGSHSPSRDPAPPPQKHNSSNNKVSRLSFHCLL